MDFHALWTTLDATLTDDNRVRKAAEAALKQYEAVPEFLGLLMRIVATTELPAGGRLAAAITFKNAIERIWHHDDPSVPGKLGEDTKAAIRSSVIELTAAQTERPIIDSLVIPVREIFRHDFPDRWPALPQLVLANLTSDSPTRISNTLAVLRSFAWVYETKDPEALAPMDMIVNAVFPTMLQVARVLIAAYNTPEAAQALRMIAKTYYLVVKHHLEYHSHLYNKENFIAWCGVWNALISKHLPEPGEPGEPAGQPVSADARENWIWWKVKKWAVKNCNTLAEVYAQPLHENKPHMKELTTLFNKHIAPEMTASLLGLFVDWRARGRFLTARIKYYALHVLQACLDYASSWSVIKPHMAFMIKDVCFELYKLTKDEIDLISDDPQEYMRMSVDPMQGHRSPRMSATLFVNAGVHHRRKATIGVIDALFIDVLTRYTTAPPERRDYAEKEALLFLFQDLSLFFMGEKEHRKQVETILGAHVIPEFQSPMAFLRARALAVWASYCHFGFSNAELPHQAFQATLALMKDPEPVVRLTAGGCLTPWIERCELVRPWLAPVVLPAIEQLFLLLGDMGLDEVVATITTVLDSFPEVVPHVGPAIVTRMIALLNELLLSTEADGVTLEDESALAGEGMLETVSAVLGALHSQEHIDVVISMLPSMWTLIGALFQTSGPTLEYLQNGFDLFGDVVVALEDRCAQMNEPWLMLIKMLDCYTACALDYTESMSYPASALMSYCPDRFAAPDPATGCDYLVALARVGEFAIAHADEREVGMFGRLMLELMHNMRGKVDRVVPTIVQQFSGVLRTGKTKYLRSIAGAVIAQALAYNPAVALSGLEAAGSTLDTFSEWLVAISKNYYKKSTDCKICIFGLSTMLRLPLAALPPAIVAILPQIISGIVALQIKYERLLTTEAEERHRLEEEEKDLDEASDVDSDFFPDAGDDDGVDKVDEEDAEFISQHRHHKADDSTGHVPRAPDELYDGDSDVGSEPPPAKTAIDHIEHLLHLQDAITALSSQPQAAAIQSQLTPEVQTALQMLMHRAGELRAQGRQPGEFGPMPDAPPGSNGGAAGAAAVATR